MKLRIVLSLLILTVCVATPASANWFSNPKIGINRHVATAPSPTPDDVRAGRQPMLVRDTDGNVIAMIDPSTGKIIATAEPPRGTQVLQSNSTPASKPATTR